MKDRDKPKKSTAIAGKPAKRNALPIRAARPTPVRGKVLAAVKKADIPTAHEPEVSFQPPVSAKPLETSLRLAARWRFPVRGSSRLGINPDPNLDTGEPLDHNQSRECPAGEEYLDLDTSSSNLESISEYLAEEEVEAAMLEADHAMQTDESALMFDQGMEAVELTQDGVSCG